MQIRLTDDAAVIVGGASGIGAAIAEEFAAAGAKVCVLDANPQCPDMAHALAAAHGIEMLGLTVDAADYAAVQAAADKIRRQWERCDHLVYAAGIGSGKVGFPFWNLEPADWPRVLQVNLLGAVHAAQAFAPHMAAARRGTLCFIASVAGQIGSQTDPPYSASKAALINFAQCAARDLAPHNVRVNAICPGMIRTRLNEAVWRAWNESQPAERQQTYEAWGAEKVARVALLGRWQEPQDVARLALFLASPLAQNITGQTMNVDGGQVMH